MAFELLAIQAWLCQEQGQNYLLTVVNERHFQWNDIWEYWNSQSRVLFFPIVYRFSDTHFRFPKNAHDFMTDIFSKFFDAKISSEDFNLTRGKESLFPI